MLSLCITATNTFTTFLANDGTSLPAFQNLLNYILLSMIWVPVVIYKHGWKRYFGLFYREGGRYGLAWKYLCLSFLDVEGNYFTVLGYRYTNLLSIQLLNFWSIVCVVIVSFLFLGVRYGWIRVFGILVCCGGMGVLLYSDTITSGTSAGVPHQVKGDLFGLLGATFYGLSNVFEEWFVSKRPMYETLSFLGLFGMIILGVQTAIFDRESFQTSTWDGNVAGWLVGYAVVLTFFYSIAPFMFRLGSSAFFDIRFVHPSRTIQLILTSVSPSHCKFLGYSHRYSRLWIQHILLVSDCLCYDHHRVGGVLFGRLDAGRQQKAVAWREPRSRRRRCRNSQVESFKTC